RLGHVEERVSPATSTLNKPGLPGGQGGVQLPPAATANLSALFLLDTGQRAPLTVNLDYIDQRKLDSGLVMDGFLGDVGGELLPRYMLDKLTVSLGGQSYEETSVAATPQSTYSFAGWPVAGAIGFPLLARHFGAV